MKDRYREFLNHAKTSGFIPTRNTSITTLIYKEKGEIDDLKNYRPISLINNDIKILSKVLANRLNKVIPSIIQNTQTAIIGRKIDNTIHLVRDIIDFTNKNDMEGTLIFLD